MPVSQEVEDAIVSWLADQNEAMVSLLADLVNTDSHTSDKSGVDQVGALLQGFLEDQGVACETIAQEVYGDTLRASVPGKDPKRRPVLLMGHRDTVFPKGEAARRPFKIENGRAYGPGVADMKGGLVVNAFVLAAMNRFNAAPSPLIGLFTSDEEIASPCSRPIIEREAGLARAVFNSEPGRPEGNVVVGRKGGVFMRVDVHGRGAHSGSHFTYGISAVEALARMIVELNALVDLDKGITVNVGVVGGGEALNTVAPHAFGALDLRFVDPADRDRMMEKIEAVVAKEHVPGIRSELTITGEFGSLVQTPQSRKLYEIYDKAAASLGIHFGEEISGGCSDAGFASGVGTPSLCGLGPVGGGSHTIEEYIEIDTLLSRTTTLALAVARFE